jgi:heptosyltransferase-1
MQQSGYWKMNSILIVKTSALGDIVHTYPVVDYLRKKFPKAQIDWVVEAPFADLVRAHPRVNHVLTIATKSWRKKLFNRETLQAIRAFRKQLRRQNYDVVFDLQGNIKSGLIVSQARSRIKVGFGKESVPEWPNMLFTNTRFNPSARGNIREDYLSLVTSFFGDPLPNEGDQVKLNISQEQQSILDAIMRTNASYGGPTVLVCPGSAWRNKQLTAETLTNFLSLIQSFLGCNFLFVWGSPDEKCVAEKLQAKFIDCSQIVDKLSLSMLQNIMDMSDLVIAMDSLPLHLAGTTKTPSFSVFGASSALKYKPLGEKHFAYQGSCPYGRTFVKRCPILRTCPTGACIRDLAAVEIFEAFKQWWKEVAKRLECGDLSPLS